MAPAMFPDPIMVMLLMVCAFRKRLIPQPSYTQVG
jgi:hypothetical protein